MNKQDKIDELTAEYIDAVIALLAKYEVPAKFITMQKKHHRGGRTNDTIINYISGYIDGLMLTEKISDEQWREFISLDRKLSTDILSLTSKG